MQEDIVRYLHLFWAIQQNNDWLFLERHWPQLSAPFGWDVQNTAQPLFWWAGAAFSKWVNAWTFNNWVIAISFPLAGWFFFKLAFDMTESYWGSLLGGFLFMFSPWHFAKAEAYPEMASIEFVPLYVWALLRFFRSPTGLKAAWTGLAFMITFNFSCVLGTMIGLMAFLAVCVWIFYQRIQKGSWEIFSLSTLAFLFLVHGSALLSAVWETSVFTHRETLTGLNAFHRVPLSAELALGTVGPLNFFLPTYYHPLWGHWVDGWMHRLKPGTWLFEDVVNPGFLCWALALTGIASLFRDKKSRVVGWALLSFTIFSIWMCWNPVFGKLVLPFPNSLLYSAFPAFRFYERFGIFVSLGFCLLAVWGFERLTPNWKSPPKACFAAMLMGVAAFELYCPTSTRILDVSRVPEEYRWLREQKGDFIVAEYPMVTKNVKFEPAYLFWQTYHGKRLFNLEYQELGQTNNDRKVRETVADLSSRRSIDLLKALGVRYVIVHRLNYIADKYPGKNPRLLLDTFPLPWKIKGLQLVNVGDLYGVYKVESL
jgi:hypothetical protein